MSGFVGVISLTDAPVSLEMIEVLTGSLAFRGPDLQYSRVIDSVALGCAVLRIPGVPGAERQMGEHQPCTLDNNCWIVADCRIDARQALVQQLEASGRTAVREASDPELILHAYAVWGTDCTSRLLGDFSFVLWDRRERRLLCARDQIGVKLLYYACLQGMLVVSNTLDTILLHPFVSNAVNERAVADFLLFGHNHDLSTTSYRDVQRIPAGHTLTWHRGSLSVRSYWKLPIDPIVRFRSRQDCTESFLELFRTVMRDRLQTDRAAILMSGGLDSTGMAAVARDLVDDGLNVELSAHTVVFDSLIPHEERGYATQAASFLRMPIHFQAADGHPLFGACLERGRRIPEPGHIPDIGPIHQGIMGAVAEKARVAFFGEGPDDALSYEWQPYVRHELRQQKFGGLLLSLLQFPFLFKQLPLWGRSRARGSDGPPAGILEFPPWLDPHLVKRLDLRERFHRGAGGNDASVDVTEERHPVRPLSYERLTNPLWQTVFEAYDAGVTGVPVEVRHPFMDIRMLRFFLAVPVIPWCRNKYLLRSALKRSLPADVVARPKTGLPGFPGFERWKLSGLPGNIPTDLLKGFVDVDLLSRSSYHSASAAGANLRAYKLAFFLAQS